jgi:hypothetical protein
MDHRIARLARGLLCGVASALLLAPAHAGVPTQSSATGTSSTTITATVVSTPAKETPGQPENVGAVLELLDSGRSDLAGSLLEAQASSGNATPSLLLALGRAFLAYGRWERAVTVLEEAVAFENPPTDLHYYLGLAYFRAGRDEDAARTLARNDFQSTAAREGARFYRGLALIRLGRVAEARSQIRPCRRYEKAGGLPESRVSSQLPVVRATPIVDPNDPNSILDTRRRR